MDAYVRWFIRSSLVWLGAGVVLGTWMAVDPAAGIYRPAHMHTTLLGFVSMMIFGVAYHVLPRFTGSPLRSTRAALVHVVLANAGLGLMVAAWLLRAAWAPVAVLLPVGAVLSGVGAFLFIGNIWLTMNGAGAPVAIRRTAVPRV
jgi:cbb3-type cytochrome oxidase subunit 1